MDIIWNLTRACPYNCKICSVCAVTINKSNHTNVRKWLKESGQELKFDQKLAVLNDLAKHFDLLCVDFSGGDPLLYKRIKESFPKNNTYLFNIVAKKSDRLKWIGKRETTNPKTKKIKYERDRNKRAFGIAATMTHPDTTTIKITSIKRAIQQIKKTISTVPSKKNKSTQKHKTLLKRTKQTHYKMKTTKRRIRKR